MSITYVYRISNTFVSCISDPMKKQVRRLFPVYTKSAARNRLEITASVIIANEFYPSLQGS